MGVYVGSDTGVAREVKKIYVGVSEDITIDPSSDSQPYLSYSVTPDPSNVIFWGTGLIVTESSEMQITNKTEELLEVNLSVEVEGEFLSGDNIQINQSDTSEVITLEGSTNITGSSQNKFLIKLDPNGSFSASCSKDPDTSILYFTFDLSTKKYNVSKKVLLGYVGVGGIARPFFDNDTRLKYYGSVSPLRTAKRYLAATTVGNYALFGGGYNYSAAVNYYYKDVDAYDSSLIRSSPPDLKTGREDFSATTVGNYALFGGGRYPVTNTVDAYNSTLIKQSVSNLSTSRFYLSATTVGNYALFGGGTDNKNSFKTVDSYDRNLLKGTASDLSYETSTLSATTVGNYALFGGGIGSDASAIINVYSADLTKLTDLSFSESRSNAAATTVGNYALFGGGTTYTSNDPKTVEVFDFNLIKGSAANLRDKNRYPVAITIGDFALFGVFDSFNIDAYNSLLTKISVQPLSKPFGSSPATATVGNYALFGGGYDYPTSTTDVEAYTQKDACIIEVTIKLETSYAYDTLEILYDSIEDTSTKEVTINRGEETTIRIKKGSTFTIKEPGALDGAKLLDDSIGGFIIIAVDEDTVYINPKYPKNTLKITFD